MVDILPNAEILPMLIASIQQAVSIAVVLFQRFKTILSLTAISKQGMVAE